MNTLLLLRLATLFCAIYCTFVAFGRLYRGAMVYARNIFLMSLSIVLFVYFMWMV